MSKVAKFPVQEGLHVVLEVGLAGTLITTPIGSVSLQPDAIMVEIRTADGGCYVDKFITIEELVKQAGYI